jgi:flavodoxin
MSPVPFSDKDMNDMKAIVIFDTRCGNTEKIAKCLERGLKEAGLSAVFPSSSGILEELVHWAN